MLPSVSFNKILLAILGYLDSKKIRQLFNSTEVDDPVWFLPKEGLYCFLFSSREIKERFIPVSR